MQVKTEGPRVMRGSRFNLQRGIHVKRGLKHVKP